MIKDYYRETETKNYAYFIDILRIIFLCLQTGNQGAGQLNKSIWGAFKESSVLLQDTSAGQMLANMVVQIPIKCAAALIGIITKAKSLNWPQYPLSVKK